MKGLKITVRVEEITEVDGQEIIPIGSSFGEFVLPEALAYLGLTLREDFLSAFDWIAIDFVNENGEPVMRMRRAYKPKS